MNARSITPAVAGEEFRDDFRKALPPEVVRRLARISAARAWWSVAQEAPLLSALIAIALALWTPVIVLACVLLIGTRQHALFILRIWPSQPAPMLPTMFARPMIASDADDTDAGSPQSATSLGKCVTRKEMWKPQVKNPACRHQ